MILAVFFQVLGKLGHGKTLVLLKYILVKHKDEAMLLLGGWKFVQRS